MSTMTNTIRVSPALRTAAGRDLLHDLDDFVEDGANVYLPAILAIEAEAAQIGAEAMLELDVSGNVNRAMAETFRQKDVEASAPVASAEALRPEVLAFAHLMERVLRENDWKGGWKECSTEYLRGKLAEEYREFIEASEHGTLLRTDESMRTAEWPADIAREAADVANIAMMIADVMGVLDAASPSDGARE